MANTRNTLKEASSPTAILELSRSAQEGNGNVLGIGLCGLNPSGCYDIAKGISLQFQNVPFVRVEYSNNPLAFLTQLFGIQLPQVYKFLDIPPQFNTKCDTVFFTGCGMESTSMSSILNSLSQQYQFTNIRYVYQIVPPHHPENMAGYKNILENTLRFFKNSSYQFRFMYSGVDTRSPSNIGMPRFTSKPSGFKVPVDCYGVIRHRQVEDFLPLQNNKCSPDIEEYLDEYFRQVAYAGKDSINNRIMVIAIGIESPYQQRIIDIARQYSVDIDFCDQYPGNRLPHQEDFFQLLATMKDRKGIVSFDETSTQCLLQALSFEASVMIYSHGRWSDFYNQLVSLVPTSHQPTAQVILGLDDNYALLKDRVKCQMVYESLHLEINKAHQKFDNFRKIKPLATLTTKLNLGSPITASGDAYLLLKKQFKAVLKLDSKPSDFDALVQSIDQRDFEQALRRICNFKDIQRVFPFCEILLHFKTQLNIKINAQAGKEQYAAIHYAAKRAAEQCDHSIYDLLIAHGADENLLDAHGENAKKIFSKMSSP